MALDGAANVGGGGLSPNHRNPRYEGIAETYPAETFAESDLTLQHSLTRITSESVALMTEEVIDDFADQDTTTLSGNWDGWSGDTGSMSFGSVGGFPNNDQCQLSSSNDVARMRTNRTAGKIGGAFSVRVYIGDDVGANDDVMFYVEEENARTMNRINFEGGGAISVYGDNGTEDTGLTWEPTTVYLVEWVPDYLNDEAQVLIDGQDAGTYPISNGYGPLGRVELNNATNSSGGSRDVWTDDWTVPSADNGAVTVEWPHPPDILEWDIATFRRTADGETIDVYVEEDRDGGWTEVAGPIAPGDPIPADAENNVRLRVELARNDTANNPTADALYRRYKAAPT